MSSYQARSGMKPTKSNKSTWSAVSNFIAHCLSQRDSKNQGTWEERHTKCPHQSGKYSRDTRKMGIIATTILRRTTTLSHSTVTHARLAFDVASRSSFRIVQWRSCHRNRIDRFLPNLSLKCSLEGLWCDWTYQLSARFREIVLIGRRVFIEPAFEADLDVHIGPVPSSYLLTTPHDVFDRFIAVLVGSIPFLWLLLTRSHDLLGTDCDCTVLLTYHKVKTESDSSSSCRSTLPNASLFKQAYRTNALGTRWQWSRIWVYSVIASFLNFVAAFLWGQPKSALMHLLVGRTWSHYWSHHLRMLARRFGRG